MYTSAIQAFDRLVPQLEAPGVDHRAVKLRLSQEVGLDIDYGTFFVEGRGRFRVTEVEMAGHKVPFSSLTDVQKAHILFELRGKVPATTKKVKGLAEGILLQFSRTPETERQLHARFQQRAVHFQEALTRAQHWLRRVLRTTKPPSRPTGLALLLARKEPEAALRLLEQQGVVNFDQPAVRFEPAFAEAVRSWTPQEPVHTEELMKRYGKIAKRIYSLKKSYKNDAEKEAEMETIIARLRRDWGVDVLAGTVEGQPFVVHPKQYSVSGFRPDRPAKAFWRDAQDTLMRLRALRDIVRSAAFHVQRFASSPQEQRMAKMLAHWTALVKQTRALLTTDAPSSEDRAACRELLRLHRRDAGKIPQWKFAKSEAYLVHNIQAMSALLRKYNQPIPSITLGNEHWNNP